MWNPHSHNERLWDWLNGPVWFAAVSPSSLSLIPPALSCTPSSYPSPPTPSLLPSVHCLSTFPEVTGVPMRFAGLSPPLPSFSRAHSARGLGRSVISPVFSLTWNIWHCDTRKPRESVCVCVCKPMCTPGDGKFLQEGSKGFVILYFFIVSSYMKRLVSTAGPNRSSQGFRGKWHMVIFLLHGQTV